MQVATRRTIWKRWMSTRPSTQLINNLDSQEGRGKFYEWLVEHNDLAPTQVRKVLKKVDIPRIKWSKQEVVVLYDAMLRCNMKDDALNLFTTQVDSSSPNVFNRILRKVLKSHKIEMAMETFEAGIKIGLPTDVITYTTAIAAYGRGSRQHASQAFTLFQEMRDKGIEPNYRTYFALIVAGATIGSRPLVMDVLSMCSNLRSAELYAVFARSIIDCGRARKGAFAYELFQLLLDRDIVPDQKLYNFAISACGQSGRVKDAESIFQHMTTHSFAVPGLYTFNAMISVYGHAFEVEKAQEMYTNMKELGIQPDLVTYNSMLYAFALGRRHDLATDLFQQMPIAPDMTTLNTMILAATRSNEMESAERYFDSIPKHCAPPKSANPLRRCKITYENMAEGYLATGHYDQVIGLWRNDLVCRRRTKSSKMLHLLLRACKELGDYDTAMELFEEFRERGVKPRVTMYNHLLSILVERKAIVESMSLFEDYRSNGVTPNVLSYTMLLEMLVEESDQHLLVLDLYRDFIRLRYRETEDGDDAVAEPCPMVFLLVVEDSLANGDYEQVVKVFEDITSNEDADQFTTPVKVQLFRNIILAFEHLGEWNRAVELYDYMQSTDIGHDKIAYEATLRVVAKAGEFESALAHGDWYRTNRQGKSWF